MSVKTESELLFEQFCADNDIPCSPYGTSKRRSPDYRINIGGTDLCVELKQIESRDGMKDDGRMSRVVGDRIRREIRNASDQVQEGARAGLPTILLVYNAVDPLQAFGTEPHDFIAAMYGAWTIPLVDGRLGAGYHGLGGKMRTHNTSFSAVGQLRRTAEGAAIEIYENVNAKHPLPYEKLPTIIKAIRADSAT